MAKGRPGDAEDFAAARQAAGTNALQQPLSREKVTPSPSPRTPPPAPRRQHLRRPRQRTRLPRNAGGSARRRQNATNRPARYRPPTTQNEACRKHNRAETHATPQGTKVAHTSGGSEPTTPQGGRRGPPQGHGTRLRGRPRQPLMHTGHKGGGPPDRPTNKCKPSQYAPQRGRSCAYEAG